MQSNRKMRKLGSRDEHGVSKQSILSAMDRFVSAVDNMNETVMVPSRLMDMAADDDHQTVQTTSNMSMSSLTSITSLNSVIIDQSPSPSSSAATSGDLFAFFNMLNAAKNELIWGGQSSTMVVKQRNDNNNDRSLSSIGNCSSLNGPTSIRSSSSISSNRSRRLSIVSSMSLSDSEADTESLSESDSGLEYDERSSNAARNFRHHLNGLYKALQQMTSAADVLTGRYQDEVGGAS